MIGHNSKDTYENLYWKKHATSEDHYKGALEDAREIINNYQRFIAHLDTLEWYQFRREELRRWVEENLK